MQNCSLALGLEGGQPSRVAVRQIWNVRRRACTSTGSPDERLAVNSNQKKGTATYASSGKERAQLFHRPNQFR